MDEPLPLSHQQLNQWATEILLGERNFHISICQCVAEYKTYGQAWRRCWKSYPGAVHSHKGRSMFVVGKMWFLIFGICGTLLSFVIKMPLITGAYQEIHEWDYLCRGTSHQYLVLLPFWSQVAAKVDNPASFVCQERTDAGAVSSHVIQFIYQGYKQHAWEKKKYCFLTCFKYVMLCLALPCSQLPWLSAYGRKTEIRDF